MTLREWDHAGGLGPLGDGQLALDGRGSHLGAGHARQEVRLVGDEPYLAGSERLVRDPHVGGGQQQHEVEGEGEPEGAALQVL